MPKTVLITGASSGFGEACAEKFAQSGDSLILLARRLDRLKALAQRVDGKSAVHIDQLDVTDPKA